MKYDWYYTEVFLDVNKKFEKKREAGEQIPQQRLLEGAFQYLDRRHEFGEDEQYDQDQMWKHRMESGCGDSELCTDLYWVFTFCSMMSDLSVYLDGMVQGNGEMFRRGLNKVLEPFDGRLSYAEQAAYRLDGICYVVMTINEQMECPDRVCREIAGILEEQWTTLSRQLLENGRTARLNRYAQVNRECLEDSALLAERMIEKNNGQDESEDAEGEDEEDGLMPEKQGPKPRRKAKAVKRAAGMICLAAAMGVLFLVLRTPLKNMAANLEPAKFERVSDETGILNSLEHLTGGTLEVSSQLTGKSGTVYGASYLMDGDTKTPWQEGVEGDGIGEKITYQPEEGAAVCVIRIYPGNGRSESAFQENNRPETMTLSMDGKEQILKLDDAGQFYTFSSKKPVKAKEITLTIDSVYKGSKWQDTCISELEFYGTKP